MQNGSENGVKMEPRSGKREPETHVGAYERIGVKMFQKCKGELPGTARDSLGRPKSRAWVPLTKIKHKSEPLISRVRDREGIIRRPLVPEGTVADLWMAICTQKKPLQQDCRQEKDVSNPRVAIFTDKKTLAASWLAAKGVVKSRGSHFHCKNSAYGKLVSSDRACQILGGLF